MSKSDKKQSNSNPTNTDKITAPINYPNHRSKKENIAIPSDLNVELSRKWIELNKL